MFSENFMRYLIEYQSDEAEPVQTKVKQTSKSTNKPLMVDLIGVKYAAIPIKHTSK